MTDLQKQIIKTILIYSFVIMCGLLFIKTMIAGISGQERSECLQWAMQAQQDSQYYLVGWQDKQCRHYQIIINTTIK